MSSLIDDVMTGIVPTFFRVFGERQPTMHTNSDGDETAVTIILDTALVPAGEYGERMEQRTTVETSMLSAQTGDTWTIAQEATDDDPYPDPVVWKAEQILVDDGLTKQFLVRKVTE